MRGLRKNKESLKAEIIVPVYCAEQYLVQCLDSLIQQDYGNYHITVVDDCSPDNGLKIAVRYQNQYPAMISIIENKENVGQGRSRMRAVYATDADYIMFVDSDDYVAPDYVSRYMRECEDGEYDLVIGGFIKDIGGKLKPFEIADCEYTILLYSVACCKAFRREFLVEHGIDFSDSRKGEDIYFSVMLYCNQPKYKIIGYKGYYYRLNPSSTTRSMNYENDYETIVMKMFAQARERIPAEKMTEDMRRKVEYCYIANIVNALVVYNHGCGRIRMREKLRRVEEDLKEHYPNYMCNGDLRLFMPRGISAKIRAGVGVFYWSGRLGLRKVLFSLVAIV